MRNDRIAYLAGPLAFTGVQMIAPTLPLIGADLGLTNAELALVSSVYLLPAAVFALPSGFLADRWGRRRVLGLSMMLFGACGLLYLVVGDSFSAFLMIRFTQGLAFAPILPLTITILGDTFRGNALVRAQGYRSLSLGIGETVLPVIGGLLGALSWESAWVVQSAALPFGVLVLFTMSDDVPASSRRLLARGRDLAGMLRQGPIAALQWVGVQRMFVKFSLLAFLPVFLVDTRGLSTSFVGMLIGLSAATGVAVAAFAGRLSRHGTTTAWVGGSMLLVAVSVVGMVLSTTTGLVLAFAVIYGAADGMTGVLSNSLVAVAATGEVRASFVAATGALRNLAKFLAPTAFGAMVLVLPIGVSFLVLGGAGAVGSLVSRTLKPLERGLNMEGAHV